MKTPGIIDGVVVAMLIAVGAGIASLLLGGFIGPGLLFNLVLLWATPVYLIYLLRRSDARIGRVVTLAGWAALSFACWLFDVPLIYQALVQAAFIWLTRSLYFHNSLLAAALDFGLVATGVAVGAWALVNTGSPAAVLWSFFLLQCLFSWIPDPVKARDGETRLQRQERCRFQSAHRVAVDAVRKLSQP
ncbi:MAG TPA: hypothetical protein VKB27_02040 [Gammaproteobacteria bacterium]|nr:hypothetical protein [Gammaproteobacteria bacterium]